MAGLCMQKSVALSTPRFCKRHGEEQLDLLLVIFHEEDMMEVGFAFSGEAQSMLLPGGKEVASPL